MNQFKFGDHVKHPKHKGKLIFIESFEEVSLLKKEWAEVLSEEASWQFLYSGAGSSHFGR